MRRRPRPGVNALKADRDQILARLTDAGVEAAPTPYSPLGLRVAGKLGAAKALDVFEHGLVESAGRGSQLRALLTGAKRGEMVVDFCAGAGGKTLALGAQMRNTGRPYAFDVPATGSRRLKPRPGAQRSSATSTRRRSPMSATTGSSAWPARSTASSSTRRAAAREPCAVIRPRGASRPRASRRWRRPSAPSGRRGAAGQAGAGGWFTRPVASSTRKNRAVASEFDASRGAEFVRLPALAALQRARRLRRHAGRR
jgi:16S rRNA (cytosine967-C5)-methyltransferase